MMDDFQVPIVLFLFKRPDKTVKIINQIAKVKPRTVYLLSDGGRSADEQREVEVCRQAVESAIDWNCTVFKKYADKNIGVYKNIAEGARWVFSREDRAIFLEDDNFPELTFFRFCNEILEKYQDDTRVLWVCGTNYLKECEPADGSSYVYTKNMMPCGWASWASKFNKFYDGELALWRNNYIRKKIKSEYLYKRLYSQDAYNLDYELDAYEKFGRFYSWDYQMAFTMRVHNLYAVMPRYNQIKNIGVDALSTHGGTSLENTMVERFCELPTKPMTFPLQHPKAFMIDNKIELAVAKLICDPNFFSVKARISRYVRRLFNINKAESVVVGLKRKVREWR